jgi:ATP-dependent DNA helicase RecQ
MVIKLNLEKILYDVFGFNQFRMGQKEVISSLIEKKDTVGVLPTGTGKTLCYQFMGHILDGHILIISPLLSLMQDQVEQMKASGEKRVIAINSFLTLSEKNKAMRSLKDYKYIFISPEMLQVDSVIHKLQILKLSLFVVDEAHCISQWGYDFRTDYIKLGEVRQRLSSPLTLALTATATPEVTQDIINTLNIHESFIYETSVDRPNISLKIEVYDDSKAKQQALINHLLQLEGPGIIYFSSKKLAEQTAEILKRNGISKVMAYHGGMSHEDRILIQQQFLNAQLDYICATSAFGMGINKEDVRFVIHFHMPLQIESYLQEIGRAGRDGHQSIAILLYSRGDESLAFQLAEGELPSHSQLDWLFNQLMQDDQTTAIPELLFQQGGFTDVQCRVTADFFTNQIKENKNIEDIKLQLKDFVTLRKNYKTKKILEMVGLIKQSECRRNTILNYFNETNPRKKVPNCCDICGIDLTKYYPNEKIKVVEEPVYEWVHVLTNLLTPVVSTQNGRENKE